MRIPLGVRAHAGTSALLVVLTVIACLLVAGLPRTMQASFDEALRRSLTEAEAVRTDLTVTGAPALPAGELYSRAQFEGGDLHWRRLLPPALRPLIGPGGHISAKTHRTPVNETSAFRNFVNLGWLSDAARRVDWVRGRAPGKPSTMRYQGATIPVVEVGVVEEAVSRMGLDVGQTRMLGESVHTAVRIVGVFRARDPAGRSWSHDADVLHVTKVVPVDGPEELHTTALMSDDGLGALTNRGRTLTYRWVLALDGRAASALDVPGVEAAAAEFQRQVDVQGTGTISYRLVTGLPQLLTGFKAAMSAAQTVMYLVLGGLFAVALGVIALAARLLTDRMERTLALARARGASLWQVVSAGSALTAVLVGPAALAGYALSFLLPGPVLPIVHLGPAVVVVAVVAFAVARLVLAHRTPLREHRADLVAVRPSARRVTVEALVVVLALAGAYLLRARGQSGTGQQDPFLLLIPVALTLAAALITLRCYPYPLRLLVRLAARGRAAVPFLGSTRAARERSVGALPVLILLPALSLSVFAAVVHDGITATQRLASWQKVGAPIKLTSAANIPPDVVERVRRAPGVEQVALALTGRVQLGATGEWPYAVAVDLAQWRRVNEGAPMGLPELSGPASALVSPALGGQGAVEVRWLSAVRLTVQGVIDAVPGFYADGQFLLVPREVLPWPAANTLLIRGDISPAELARLVPAATVETQEAALAAIQADPLTGTVRATMVVVTVALGAYALVAIVLSLAAGAAGRARAVSLLRTLGLSDRQARRLTLLELMPVVLVTAPVGVALGMGLPAALGPGVDMSAFAGGLPVADHTPGLLTPVALAAGLGLCAVLGAYAHTAMSRRRNLDAALRVGDP
ncbi:putative ABC transport system permease protein [Nonomuraea thailandensis]|uniref:ABC transport system permease protein n=1 Tax=Nonomuraea thailandensis TaxID=1188745 RepID=A0A9X2H2K0_9ACTN|nr:FtsX-like permease family protein [Nonomuraea thailandensis]MCP2365403.1 putative ABC transport system permease protein [Nonomuraea thailandensis]